MYNVDCLNWGTLCNSGDIITCEDCPHFTPAKKSSNEEFGDIEEY